MRDFWLTQELLQATGIAFIVLSLIGIALALWLPKKWWGKLLAVAAVAFLISIPVRQSKQEAKQQEVIVDDFKERYAKAKALFDERCKTAGETIFKTVENVEGIYLMKMRPASLNLSNQYALDDPYGSDGLGDGYAASILWGRSQDVEWFGYRFVVAKNESNSNYVKFKLGARQANEEPPTVKTAVNAAPQFGITYTDISTKDDRDNWIAGSKLEVIDTKTGETLAARVEWMFDSGLGNESGGRSPWSYAAYNACPAFPKLHDRYPLQTGQTLNFARKVLKPIKGE